MRLRNTLIHLLGGVTETECYSEAQRYWHEGYQSCVMNIKSIADNLNGRTGDEWAREMYMHIESLNKILNNADRT